MRITRTIAHRMFLAVVIAASVAFGPTGLHNLYYEVQGKHVPITIMHNDRQAQDDAAAEGRDAPPCDLGLYLGWDGTCWPINDPGGN